MKKNIKNKCIDCGKQITNHAKRCIRCSAKLRYVEKNKCIDCGKEIQKNTKRCRSCASIYYTIHHNAGWKGGGKHKCIDCGKELRAYHHSKRCNSCAHKYLWNRKDFQRKQAVAQNRKPNTKETTLNKLLNKNFPKEYKYVGDFQFFLGGKNPDFINVNGQKKLIELYGSYWHKDDDPKERINHFKKYGFDTLIIWEQELKNISKLERKLDKFHNKTYPKT